MNFRIKKFVLKKLSIKITFFENLVLKNRIKKILY